MGEREEKVTQKGFDPKKDTRPTKHKSPRKNLEERCFQPVLEYLFTRDKLYSIMTPPGVKLTNYLTTVKSRSGWMSRGKKEFEVSGLRFRVGMQIKR